MGDLLFGDRSTRKRCIWTYFCISELRALGLYPQPQFLLNDLCSSLLRASAHITDNFFTFCDYSPQRLGQAPKLDCSLFETSTYLDLKRELSSISFVFIYNSMCDGRKQRTYPQLDLKLPANPYPQKRGVGGEAGFDFDLSANCELITEN